MYKELKREDFGIMKNVYVLLNTNVSCLSISKLAFIARSCLFYC